MMIYEIQITEVTESCCYDVIFVVSSKQLSTLVVLSFALADIQKSKFPNQSVYAATFYDQHSRDFVLIGHTQ